MSEVSSITTWVRLEPRPRDENLTDSLQAKVQDPLWLLARQWQLGEFQGEDCGSPVKAELAGTLSRLNHYAPGAPYAEAPQAYDPRKMPLEARAERETVLPTGATNARLAAQLGRQFLHFLGPAWAGKYRRELLDAYALEHATKDSDRRGSSFQALLAGRALDGLRLRACLEPTVGETGDLPGGPPFDGIAGADRPATLQAAKDWLTWCRNFLGLDAMPAWVAEKMEYGFTVSASTTTRGETLLRAAEHRGDRLDWYSFDVAAPRADPEPWGQPEPPSDFARTVIPTPIHFQGMPAPRWWEFEDSRVSFGSVETGPEDLAKLLLMEFTLAYGNDFFVIPVTMDIGSLCQLNTFKVTNTFGEVTSVKSTAEWAGGWRMFAQTEEAPNVTNAASLFFLAPALGPVLEASPLEEVRFLRDEMANLAWAVERTVQSPAGLPLDRYELYQEKRPQPEAAPSVDAGLEYRLVSEVPDYWFPLFSQHTPRLPDGRRPRETVLALGGFKQPLGVLLQPPSGWTVHEEEVPRAGAIVTRGYQFCRWTDGSSHLWIGRVKKVGRGEGSSGLRFDQVGPKGNS